MAVGKHGGKRTGRLLAFVALIGTVLAEPPHPLAAVWNSVFRLPDALRPYYDRIGVSLEVYNGDASWELPMPATFVVDQTGIISLAYVDADYTRRLEPLKLLAALERP